MFSNLKKLDRIYLFSTWYLGNILLTLKGGSVTTLIDCDYEYMFSNYQSQKESKIE